MALFGGTGSRRAIAALRHLVGCQREFIDNLVGGWVRPDTSGGTLWACCGCPLLVERGAPINAKSRNWLIVRPLQSATAGRRLPVVELLLKVGANVNERQSGKWTAAAQHGDVAIVMELRRHGADRSALNAEGKNAARIVREAGHNELARDS
jgi:ankyrin repeat protein